MGRDKEAVKNSVDFELSLKFDFVIIKKLSP
jgi:hypothetical protein